VSLRSRFLVAAAVLLVALAVTGTFIVVNQRRVLIEQVDAELRASQGPITRLAFFPGRDRFPDGPRGSATPTPSSTPPSIPGETSSPPSTSFTLTPSDGSIPSAPPPGTFPGRPDNGGPGAGPGGDANAQTGALSNLWVGEVLPDGTIRRWVVPGLGPSTEPTIDVVVVREASVSRVTFQAGSTDGSQQYRLLAQPIGSSGRIAVTGLTLAKADQATHELVVTLALVYAGVVALMALLGFWVWRLGLTPINKMTEAADAIREGERDRRIEQYPPKTEAGRMASALNTMLDERQAVEDGLRRFVGDASHELRTPLTSIHGYVDLYQRGGLPDREALDDAMRRISHESTRMIGLVDDLLLLARLDQSRPLEERVVDAAEVLRDAASDAAVVAPGRTITVHTEDPLVLRGDEYGVRQVVAALVTNAIVHTPGEASIELRGSHAPDGSTVLEVADDGPGMPPEVADHAFERFFRGDPSRSRHRGGSGLGLAIVQSVVTHHGGRVHLETAAGAGTTVRLTFPPVVEPPDAELPAYPIA
jgi:two-component system OmpR family sensor kinase